MRNWKGKMFGGEKKVDTMWSKSSEVVFDARYFEINTKSYTIGTKATFSLSKSAAINFIYFLYRFSSFSRAVKLLKFQKCFMSNFESAMTIFQNFNANTFFTIDYFCWKFFWNQKRCLCLNFSWQCKTKSTARSLTQRTCFIHAH